MRMQSLMAAVLAGPVFLAIAGCGGVEIPSVSSSTEEATVQGTVMYKGHPPGKAKITFDPSNIHRQVAPSTADVSPDGTYRIKSLVGENVVTVSSPELEKDPAAATNSQVIILKPGANDVPINL